MVSKLGDWKWSGYRYYAFGDSNALLTSHVTYLSLGDSLIKRQESYRAIVEMSLPGDEARNPAFSDVPSIA